MLNVRTSLSRTRPDDPWVSNIAFAHLRDYRFSVMLASRLLGLLDNYRHVAAIYFHSFHEII